jgi:hypothetical protein
MSSGINTIFKQILNNANVVPIEENACCVYIVNSSNMCYYNLMYSYIFK